MDEAWLFLVLCSAKTKSNVVKLQHIVVPYKHADELPYCEGDRGLEQVAWRGCGVFYGDTLDSSGCLPVRLLTSPPQHGNSPVAMCTFGRWP